VLGTLAGPIPPLAAAFWLAAFVKLLFFWPIVSTAVFEREQSDREWTRPEGLVSEAAPTMLGPILFTAGVAVLLGVVPTATPFFELAEAVVAEVFGP